MPEMPAPTTITALVTSAYRSSSGSSRFARATELRTRSFAFSVASDLSTCTHEHCSRMLHISNKYGFMPEPNTAPRNVGSCILGEQAATTTRVRPSSLMSFFIRSWPGS